MIKITVAQIKSQENIITQKWSKQMWKDNCQKLFTASSSKPILSKSSDISVSALRTTLNVDITSNYKHLTSGDRLWLSFRPWEGNLDKHPVQQKLLWFQWQQMTTLGAESKVNFSEYD